MKSPSAQFVRELERFDALLKLVAETHHVSRRLSESDRAQALAFVDESRELAHERPFRVAGLRQLERELLCVFREGAGEDVEDFWRRAAEAEVEVVRKKDVVSDTLRRGRVLNMIQFVTLDDAFEELQECGKLDPDETERLGQMLIAFESAPENQAFFLDDP